MRSSGLRLGRIFGVDVAADLGVMLFAGLLTWILATSVLPSAEPGVSGSAYWSVAALGTLLFIGSLLAHELGHAVVARRNDIEVVGITLWMFGGVAELRSDARSAGVELRIALAGPAMSMLVGVVSVGASIGLDRLGAPALYVVALSWLGIVNVFLAVFNLLPGAPLDGGRVLAAVIWMIRGDRLTAKVWAARTGRVLGMVVVAAGLAEVFVLQSSSGLWTVVIGWFLLTAARVEQVRYTGEAALGTTPVAAVMDRDPASVSTWSTIADAVHGPLAHAAHSVVPVMDWNHQVAGLITMSHVRRVPANLWDSTTVAEVMAPAEDLPTATPSEQVTCVLDRLHAATGGLALVLDRGHLVGVLTPAGVQRAIDDGLLARRGRSVIGGTGQRRGGPGAAPAPTGPSTPPTAPTDVPVQTWEPPRSLR